MEMARKVLLEGDLRTGSAHGHSPSHGIRSTLEVTLDRFLLPGQFPRPCRKLQ